MTDEMNRKCFEIYSEYCPRFKGFGGGIKKDDIRIRQFFDGGYEYLEYDKYAKDGVLNMANKTVVK